MELSRAFWSHSVQHEPSFRKHNRPDLLSGASKHPTELPSVTANTVVYSSQAVGTIRLDIIDFSDVITLCSFRGILHQTFKPCLQVVGCKKMLNP